MCYKYPGPRCSGHASATLAQAKHVVDNWDHANSEASATGFEEALELQDKAQADYDATPAGILTLTKRVRGERPDPEEQDRLTLGILNRKEALSKIGVEDKGDYGQHDIESVEGDGASVSRDFLDDNEARPALHREGLKENAAQALIQGSSAWMKRITAEEQEAVAWMTSSGFSIMRAHVDGREHPRWDKETDVGESISLVTSAMSKAPRLKKPVVIYRGMGSAHFVETSVEEKDSGSRTLGATFPLEAIKEKFPVGAVVDMGKIPSSGTLNPSTALSFGSGVVFEVKTSTFASPVNVSAWDTFEHEILVDHTRKYKVAAVLESVNYTSSSGSPREGVQVVQLEEVEE